MVTEFGKYLRKVRVDNNEIMKDMSDKLFITPSYLSAIECGKRRIPDDLAYKVCKLYGIDQEEINKVVSNSLNELKFTLSDKSEEDRYLITSFILNFDELTDKQKQDIHKLLKGASVDAK